MPVQYCDIMRFTVLYNRHHKKSQSVPFFVYCKTVTILLRIRDRAHFVMSISKNHESHRVTVLDNPQFSDSTISEPIKFFQVIKAFLQPGSLYITRIPSLSKAFSLIGSLGALDLKEQANLCRRNLTPRGSSGNSSN